MKNLKKLWLLKLESLGPPQGSAHLYIRNTHALSYIHMHTKSKSLGCQKHLSKTSAVEPQHKANFKLNP